MEREQNADHNVRKLFELTDERQASNYVGKTFQVRLALEFENKAYAYIFHFNIDSISDPKS